MIPPKFVSFVRYAIAMVGMVSMLAGTAAETSFAAAATEEAQGQKGGKGAAKGTKNQDATLVINIDVDGHRRVVRDYYTAVPSDWNARFPAIPAYYARYFVGRDLIVIDSRNDSLVSLIRDILD